MEPVNDYGWLSVLPPLVTIVLAMTLRRVVLALATGIGLAVVLQQPQFEGGTCAEFLFYLVRTTVQFLTDITEHHLWPQLIEPSHLRVFAFTTLLGIQVALIHRCGGMRGIVRLAAPCARSRRGGQLLTWLLGMIIFIDDYANTLLLGSTMRPVTDRLRISREKLAFLVDSTAAPVAGLALVSTWVATEISAMETGYQQAAIDIAGQSMGLFLATIPLRFYILYCLAFVLLVALLNRDFGPMLRAERMAMNATQARTPSTRNDQGLVDGRAWYAVVPVGLTLALVLILLVATGMTAMGHSTVPPLSDWKAWAAIIGSGDSYLALVYGAGGGLLAIVTIAIFACRMSRSAIGETAVEGFLHVLPALTILWLAWTLSGLTDGEHLGTGQFLATHTQHLAPSPAWIPTIVFLLAATIAFCTGTSWGTMAIVMPMVIPLVASLLQQNSPGPIEADSPLFIASIASVLAGAIFGDHCSPISDTTILSSRSSDCDHIAHVRTQMPYALVVGMVSIVCGTLPAGYGVPSWLLLPLGILALGGMLWIFGQGPESPRSRTAELSSTSDR
ncbi:MAG: membrane protein [Pirellulaceae bacterium]|nr:MAG: membrane protein [Pirellulaceae bacterium]